MTDKIQASTEIATNPESGEALARSERTARVRRVRMVILIVALCCFAFDAALAFLGTHHYLDRVKLPDKVFAFLFLGPGILGLVLLLIARQLFRKTNYR